MTHALKAVEKAQSSTSSDPSNSSNVFSKTALPMNQNFLVLFKLQADFLLPWISQVVTSRIVRGWVPHACFSITLGDPGLIRVIFQRTNRKASGSITLDQGCVCVGEKTTINTKSFVYHCHFEDNSGGALMNFGMGILSVDDSFFIENRVSSNTTHGGSVCIGPNGEFFATNCSFLNTQNTHGRCIYCEGTNEFPFAPRLSVSKCYFDSQNVSEGSSIFVSGLSVCVLGGEFMGYSRHVFGGGSIQVRVVESLEFCNDEESALTNVNFTDGAELVKFNTCEPSSETETEIFTETLEPTPEPTTSSSSAEPSETEETATETTEFVTETSEETETSSIETSFEPTEETTETENPDELSTGAIVSISISVAIVAILLIIMSVVIGRKVCCKKDRPGTKGDMQSLASVSLLQ